MRYHEEIDIKIILDKLRLLTDGVTALNKRYSQWSDLDVVQLAFPIVTYTTELLEILNREQEGLQRSAYGSFQPEVEVHSGMLDLGGQ